MRRTAPADHSPKATDRSVTAPFMSEPYLIVAQQARGGDVGVIASWNFVRFDDVVFSAQNGPS